VRCNDKVAAQSRSERDRWTFYKTSNYRRGIRRRENFRKNGNRQASGCKSGTQIKVCREKRINLGQRGLWGKGFEKGKVIVFINVPYFGKIDLSESAREKMCYNRKKVLKGRPFGGQAGAWAGGRR
jgi:hypothetical protein